MAKLNLALTVKLPWWSNAYIGTINAFAFMHGLNPDIAKCAKLIARHAKIEVHNGEKIKADR